MHKWKVRIVAYMLFQLAMQQLVRCLNSALHRTQPTVQAGKTLVLQVS